MPNPMTVGVLTLAGTVVTGMLLMGASLVGDTEAVTKRESLRLENDEPDAAPDDATDDKTLDTNAKYSAASRVRGAADTSRARDDSVDASPTSGVSRTRSGGAGTVDGQATSGVSRTASGGAGTVDGGARGGGDGSRDRSRGSGSRSRG